MVDTVFPTPNTYTSRQGRQTQAPAFAGATAARPLGANTGVRPGTPANTVTATTALVTVQPFGGVADVQTLASAGPYTFAFDAVYTVALVAQSASIACTDIVYVEIADNQEDGTGALNSSSATRKYLAASRSTGTIPALPNTRSFIIALINVPIVGSSPTVTWVAPYAVAAGGQGAVNTQSQLPASGILGDKILAYDTGVVYRFNGTAWKPWESDWIAYTPALTNITLGSGTKVGQYRFAGGQCFVEGRFVYGTGSAVLGSCAVGHPASLGISASQQSDPYPLGRADILRSGTAVYPGFATTNGSAGSAQFNYANAAGTAAVDTVLSSTAPITFATNDVIAWKYDFTPA